MANSANAISSRKRINTMRKVLIGFFSFALVLFGLTAPSQAADTLTGTTGHETSIAYTSGKAQGSNEWGLMGNVVVEKLEGKNAYPYGVEINPITGDMWVTDSGKVCWGRFQCLLGGAGLVDSAQTGTPSVRIYNLKDAADQQSGYAVDGTYSNFATHTTQSGLGQNWVPKQIIRTGVFDTDPKRHGPRGIEIAADGTVWIVDSEFTQTAAEAAADGSNKIKRFAPDGTQLAGAGYSGVWADRSPGSFRNSWSVSVTEMLNGDFLAPASTAAQLNRFAADGTAKAPILLTNLAVPAAAQDYLGTVTRIEPHGVDVDPITGNIYVVPDFAFFNANQTDANKRVGGVFVLNPEGTEILNYVNERLFPYGIPTSGSTMFGPFVNNEQNSANYGSVFAWGQVQGNTNFIELSNTGDLLHTWQSGTTAAENAQDGTNAYTPRPQIISFPGLKNPRGIAYDANGYMYMTGADSETSPAGVRIIGMTPRPVQNLKAVQKCVPAGAPTADVELTWVHDETASQSIAPTEDYVVEMTTDGGATWALVPTAKSTAKTETIPASVVAPYADEMAAGQVGFRVSAWNAAGNGDWIAATLLNDPCFKVEKTGVLAADGNTINWTITVTNTGTAALKNIQLVDHIGNDEGGELAPVFLENPTIASLEPGTPHVLQVTTDVTDEQRVAGIAYNKVDATYTDIAGNDTVKTATASVNIPNKFTVTYVDGVDGEEVFANQATSEIIYGTATPAFNGEPTRPGYTFAGWSPAVAPTVTKDVTYVAQWTPIYYTVTYVDGVDGEEVFADQINSDLAYGTTTPGFTGTPERAGYKFLGWSPAVANTVTENITYTAQWDQEFYTVTYVDGVDGEEVFADQVNSDLAYGTATPGFTGEPTREGYDFTGWAPSVADTVTASVTYTAQWKAKNYVTPTEPKSVIPLNANDPASCKIAPYAIIAPVEGVTYEVKTSEGQILTPDAAGVYHYAYGQTIIITAKANDGYVIAAGVQTEWTYTAPTVESCEDPVKPTDPVVDPDKPVDPSKPVDPTRPVNPTTPGVPPAPALDQVPTDETSGGSVSKLAKTGAESVAGLIAGAIALVGFGGLVLTRRRGE